MGALDWRMQLTGSEWEGDGKLYDAPRLAQAMAKLAMVGAHQLYIHDCGSLNSSGDPHNSCK